MFFSATANELFKCVWQFWGWRLKGQFALRCFFLLLESAVLYKLDFLCFCRKNVGTVIINGEFRNHTTFKMGFFELIGDNGFQLVNIVVKELCLRC